MKGIYKSVQVLESFAVLEVPEEIISSVARTMATAEKVRVKIGWLDELLATYAIIETISF